MTLAPSRCKMNIISLNIMNIKISHLKFRNSSVILLMKYWMRMFRQRNIFIKHVWRLWSPISLRLLLQAFMLSLMRMLITRTITQSLATRRLKSKSPRSIWALLSKKLAIKLKQFKTIVLSNILSISTVMIL